MILLRNGSYRNTLEVEQGRTIFEIDLFQYQVITARYQVLPGSVKHEPMTIICSPVRNKELYINTYSYEYRFIE